MVPYGPNYGQYFEEKEKMPKPKGNITFDDKELLLNDPSDNHLDKKCDTNQKQSNIPESILKTSTAIPSSSSTLNGSNPSKTKISRASSTATNVKPNTILSLEDRDIIVIDNVDYKESTSNEPTVIVLDKPRTQQIYQQQQQQQAQQQRDIDLADLLGSNWPTLAGDSAMALNNPASLFGSANFSSDSSNSSSYQLSSGSSSTPVTVVTQRNRSKNPLNHLGQSKVKRTVNTSGNLINLDSDGSSAGTNEMPASNSKCLDRL